MDVNRLLDGLLGRRLLADLRLQRIYHFLAVALAALLGALWMAGTVLPVSAPVWRHTLFLLVLMVPAFVIARWRGALPTWLLFGHIAASVFVVTLVVHYGGGADHTWGPVLYVGVIAFAGMVLSARAAFLVAGTSVLAYVFVVAGAYLGWFAHQSTWVRTPPEAIATVTLVCVYLLVATGLVCYVARQSHALAEHVRELRWETLGTRGLTILFAKVDGLGALAEWRGDAAAHRGLEGYHRAAQEGAQRCGGLALDHFNDGSLLAFPSPAVALGCAGGLQAFVAEWSAREKFPALALRIGIHSGEAIRTGERLFGKTVIIASRIADKARGGEILVTERACELAGDLKSFDFGAEQDVALKGLAGTHKFRQVVPRGRTGIGDTHPGPIPAG